MGNSDQLAVELATSLSSLTYASSTLSGASTTLSSAAASFAIIAQKIETRFKDLAAYEENLMERKKIIDEMSADLEQREEKVKKQEVEVTRKKKELDEQQQEWEKTSAKIKANTDAVEEIVTLIVGGTKFTLTKHVLTKYQDSFFTKLFQVDHKDNSKFFIDRNPKHFGKVVNYLHDGNLEKIKPKKIKEVREEFNFYDIPIPEIEPEDKIDEITIFDPAGDLLSSEWRKVVRSWLPSSHLLLLYKGVKDGFSPEMYHEKCDSHGPLLTVIMSSEGYLFGGYIFTTINHDSPSQNERHTLQSDSFLFTLTNPHTLPPTQFPLLSGNWPTLYTPFEHAHLGWGRWGYDLALSKTPHMDKKSYFGFPYAFKDKCGHGKLTFTGNEYFTIQDIEVFSVVPLYSSFGSILQDQK